MVLIQANFQVIESRNVDLTYLLDQFENTYIGTQRRIARFKVEIWNQFTRVNEHLCRTNNGVEAWHRQFSSLLGVQHPDIFKFIKEVSSHLSYQSRLLNQVSTGQILSPKKNKNYYLDMRLTRVVRMWGSLPILDYLRGIAQGFIY